MRPHIVMSLPEGATQQQRDAAEYLTGMAVGLEERFSCYASSAGIVVIELAKRNTMIARYHTTIIRIDVAQDINDAMLSAVKYCRTAFGVRAGFVITGGLE